MKRTITIILSIILVLANINLVAFASDDYDEQYYREAIMLLEALKIKESVSDGTLIGESVSRIDFLKAVVRAITNNANLTDVSDSIRYTDIANDAWVVRYAVSVGLISDGYKFYPDDNADLNFARAIINSAAGYEYKEGRYAQTPVESGLMKNLRTESAKSFSLGDAYVLIYNLLSTEKLERHNDAYKLSGSTILYDLYDIELIKGRMVADYESSLYGESISPYTVKIEGVNEDVSLYYGGDTKELLGRYVKAFYKDDEAILITPRYDDDILIDIGSKEYDEYDNSTRRLYYNVFESSNRWETTIKSKYEVLPQNMDIIHNGRFTDEHSKIYSILNDSNEYNIDSLVLIDSDRNGKADLMKVDTYKTAFVSKPNEEANTVKDLVTNKLIDFDGISGDAEVVVLNQDGEEVDFKSIADKSVISIFDNSNDPKKVKIIISKAVVAGRINKITDKDIVIDGEEYKLSKSFKAYRNSLNAGVTYTFYLDHNYNVCGYEIGADSLQNLGGVIKIGVDDADKSVLIFTIYTVDGNTIRLETAEKWKVNGSYVYLSSKNELMYKKADGTEADVLAELRVAFVQYKLSASGKIREIITAKKDANTEELGYTSGMNNPEEVFKNPSKYVLRYKNNGKFFIPDNGSEAAMNFAAVGPDTKIIKMPSANITSGRERYFASGITLKNDDHFPVVTYTLKGSDSITADVLVIVNDSASDPSDSRYYVVKKKSIAINNNEDVGYMLDLYDQSGTELSITTEKCDFPEYDLNKGFTGVSLDIDAGDVIRYGVNSNGDASSFVMVYDADGNKSISQNANSWYVTRRVVSGSVYSTDGDVFTYVTQKEMPDNVDGKLQMGYAKSVILVAPDEGISGYIKAGKVSDMISYVENATGYSNIVYISGYGETSMVVAYLK